MTRFRAMALAAAALAAATCFGAKDCRFLHEMTGEIVTPHYDFRGSASEKPLKALFVLDRNGARDAVEVVQRFNVEPTYFLTVGGNNIASDDMYEAAWKGTSTHEKTLELDDKLSARYDLYVFGRKAFTSVGEEHRYRILKAVRDGGAGLLMVTEFGPNKIPYKKVYREKLPDPSFLAPFPGEFKGTKLESWRVGKGRFVELSWHSGNWATFHALTPRFPIDDLWFAKFENAVAFVGQAMRYAAGRDAEPSEPVRVRLRDRFNREVADVSCAGVHYRDVVGANGSIRVEKVETPSPVGGLSLAAPETVRPGEELVAKAAWTTACERVKSAVFETVESPSWRVMTRVRVDVPAGATSIDCTIADAKVGTKAGYARVTLEDADGRPLDVAEGLVLFPRRDLDDFVQMTWDTVLSMMPFAGARQVVDRLGFNNGLTIATGGAAPVEAAVMNQSLVPFVTRIGLGSDRKNGPSRMYYWSIFLDRKLQEQRKAIVGDDCLYRPEVEELWRGMIRHRLKNLPKCAPAFYSLGDENGVDLNAGFGEYDDGFFRDFLKGKYGKIENLNRDWNTNCADFASVPHLKPDEAKKLGNLAAWADHRAYMNKMYADAHNLCRDEIRKLDPGALVGSEGSCPGDLEQTIDKLEYWGPYSDPVEDEVLRSLGGDRIRTLWWGGYVGSHGGRGKFPTPLMKDLARGTVNGSAWFAVNVGTPEGMLYSDLKLADDIAEYLDWHDRFREGLAALLIRNPLRDEGVFLYWSHPSKETSVASTKFLAPNDGLSTLVGLCYRNGRSLEFVSARTLRRLEKAKTLFLCGATALSDAECAAIRAFAKRGGTVVADVEPAVLNENLAPREKPALADLWGKGKCVLLGRKLSYALAKEKERGAFDREMLAYFPPAKEGVPVGALDRNATLRTRKGPGFDLVTAVYPVSALGSRAKVAWPGRNYVYAPCEGYVGVAKDEIDLDFTKAPFVCRAVFAEKQSAPELSAADATLGGAVRFGLPKLVSGRVYSLIVRDPGGEVRGRAVFDREEKAMRSLDVAWNDRPGTWTATLTDCATGLKTEKTFEVSEK